jgi:polysaccharide deacetylase 2 family uncharacterized protein YibQ
MMARRKKRRRRRKSRKNNLAKWGRRVKKQLPKLWFVLSAAAAAVLIYHLLPNPVAPPASPAKAAAKHVRIQTTPPRAPVRVKPTVRETSPARPVTIAAPVIPPPPPIVKGPRLTFVIDDIGNQRRYENLLAQLNDSVTYAILPGLPYSGHFARAGRRQGAEIILHLPLEALDGRYPGPGTIRSDMSRQEIITMLDRNLADVPYHVGVNNHMGSRGTSDPRLMQILLGEFQKRGLFFLDSYTTAESVIPDITKQLGMPFLRRSVFLDNEDSPELIRERVRELAQSAGASGYAIGIGHYRENTLRVLLEEIPKLRREGFQIVTLAELVRSEF